LVSLMLDSDQWAGLSDKDREAALETMRLALQAIALIDNDEA